MIEVRDIYVSVHAFIELKWVIKYEIKTFSS